MSICLFKLSSLYNLGKIGENLNFYQLQFNMENSHSFPMGTSKNDMNTSYKNSEVLGCLVPISSYSPFSSLHFIYLLLPMDASPSCHSDVTQPNHPFRQQYLRKINSQKPSDLLYTCYQILYHSK